MRPSVLLRKLSPTARFLFWTLGLNLLICAGLRFAFWLAFRSTAADAPAGDLLQSFYLGLKFDLRLTLLLFLPPLTLSFLPACDPVQRPRARAWWLAYFVCVQAALLVLYFVDFGHYAYLRTRLNAGVVEHLFPFAVAAHMAWETYPVIWGIALVAALTAGYYALLRRYALPELDRQAMQARPWARRGLAAVLVALCALGIFGKWSWYPLRWSDAYFGSNDFVAALALNPILYLADTVDNRAKDYDVNLVRKQKRAR